MVAYNFKSQFAERVESGEKRQTIRANGKRRHARPGEALQLYTGQRGPNCRKLVDPDPACVAALPVFMDRTFSDNRRVVVVAGHEVYGPPLEDLARADGFETSEEMKDFFEKTHGVPFEGTLIKW
ncbi:hypothetical protein ACR42D_10595 [Desulfovibrio caledoniensis]